MATKLSRRIFLCGAAAIGARPAAAATRQEGRRFRTGDFDVEMTVEYHDGYESSGFWFRDETSDRRFCLSADGQEGSRCIANFRGSLAIAQYKVRPRSQLRAAAAMRERVRTVDRDTRLRDRPPFERTIELQEGVGSDLQAFGYDALAGSDDEVAQSHSPWYLIRQDLFLEPQEKPFLAIFWKHALSSIRLLDIIPGEQTWLVTK